MDFHHAPNQVHQVQPIPILVSLDTGARPQAVAVANVVLEGATSIAKALRPFRTHTPHHVDFKDAKLNGFELHKYKPGSLSPNSAASAVLKALSPTPNPYSSSDFQVVRVKYPISSHSSGAVASSIHHSPNDPILPFIAARAAAERAALMWKLTIIGFACAVFLFEVYVNTRQWRLRNKSTTTAKSSQRKNDMVKGSAAYNITHSLLSFLRISLIIGFNLVPWLWVSISRLQHSFLPVMSERMADSWHCLLFFVACGLCYIFLHVLDAALHFCFKGESLWTHTCNNWTLPQVLRNVSNGRPVYIVLALSMFITLLTKPFYERITPVLLPAIVGLDLLYTILSPLLSRPRKSALSLMQDEVLVEAITELAAIAKFPLQNIFISSSPLFDEDLEEQGVMVYGWPKKHSIIVNKRMLTEFTSEDVMALLARTFGSWQNIMPIRKSFMSNVAILNTLTQLVIFISAKEIHRSFGLRPTKRGYHTAPALMVFTIALARLWHLYYQFLSNSSSRTLAFQADKYAASLGYSSELSSALAKISALTRIPEAEQDQEHVDDPLYAVIYHTQPSPQISQRLAWLEEERLKEDMKEGCIRLPVPNEKS